MMINSIPSTDLRVSQIGLGTMMFGSQVSADKATQQLEQATKGFGVNLIVRIDVQFLPTVVVARTRLQFLLAPPLSNSFPPLLAFFSFRHSRTLARYTPRLTERALLGTRSVLWGTGSHVSPKAFAISLCCHRIYAGGAMTLGGADHSGKELIYAKSRSNWQWRGSCKGSE